MFARSVVAALVAVPFLARTAFAAGCTRQYTVKEGDWCDTISAANNVSTYQLAAVNPDIDNLCHNLQANQVLCLGTEGEDCTTTHVVNTGDSCEGITGTYGINSTMLYHNNPQLDAECENLYVGEVICVANAALAPAPPAGFVATSVVPPTVAATHAAQSTHVNTPAAPPTTTAAPSTSAATPTPTPDDSDSDSDDEDNLPFCDEL